MSFFCIIGFHSWTKDCEKCSLCGKARSNAHDWRNDCEKCSRCGKARSDEHDWSKNCVRCSRCWKERSDAHNWDEDCKKCTRCGALPSKREKEKAVAKFDELRHAVYLGHCGAVRDLLAACANKDTRNKYGRTALWIAAAEGHINIVKMLLEANADKEARDSDACTALCRAAAKGHIDVVKALLEANADKEARDSDGCTALCRAAANLHFDVVKMLFAANAARPEPSAKHRALIAIAEERYEDAAAEGPEVVEAIGSVLHRAYRSNNWRLYGRLMHLMIRIGRPAQEWLRRTSLFDGVDGGIEDDCFRLESIGRLDEDGYIGTSVDRWHPDPPRNHYYKVAHQRNAKSYMRQEYRKRRMERRGKANVQFADRRNRWWCEGQRGRGGGPTFCCEDDDELMSLRLFIIPEDPLEEWVRLVVAAPWERQCSIVHVTELNLVPQLLFAAIESQYKIESNLVVSRETPVL